MVESPAENALLNASLDVFPRFQFDRPCIDRLDSATNFLLPSRSAVRIHGSVQARENLDGEFSTFIRAEAQGIGKNGFQVAVQRCFQ